MEVVDEAPAVDSSLTDETPSTAPENIDSATAPQEAREAGERNLTDPPSSSGAPEHPQQRGSTTSASEQSNGSDLGAAGDSAALDATEASGAPPVTDVAGKSRLNSIGGGDLGTSETSDGGDLGVGTNSDRSAAGDSATLDATEASGSAQVTGVAGKSGLNSIGKKRKKKFSRRKTFIGKDGKEKKMLEIKVKPIAFGGKKMRKRSIGAFMLTAPCCERGGLLAIFHGHSLSFLRPPNTRS